MANAFNKELVRSIAQSAGRFAAIAIISLLGAGVYSGLRMAAPDMRIAGDEFFDGANLYDISVVSTLGLDDESIADLGAVQGVTAVMPERRSDAMVLVGESSFAACVESLPMQAARDSDTSDGVTALSEDPAYLNRPILVEGAWPERRSECVVAARAANELGIHVGDQVRVERVSGGAAPDGGEQGVRDVFAQTRFRVAGLVNSAAYASSAMLGTTSLGTGQLDLYLFVGEDAFDDDLPYSIAYLKVEGAEGKAWGSAAYDDAVNEVKRRVNDEAAAIGQARWERVRADAQRELDDVRSDYERERADAEAELADAEAELADARRELDDAQADLAAGKADVDAGAGRLWSSEVRMQRSESDWAAGKAELDRQRAALEEQVAGMGDVAANRKQLVAGIAKAEDGIAKLDEGIQKAVSGIAQLDAGIEQAQAGVAQLEGGISQASAGVAQAEKALAQAKAAGAGKAQIAAAQAQLKAAQAQLAELKGKLKDAKAQEASLKEQRGKAQEQLSALQEQRNEVQSQLADLQQKLAQLDEGVVALQEGRTQLDAAQAQMDSARSQLDSGWSQLRQGRSQYYSGLAEYNSGYAEYQDGEREYADGLAEYEEGRAEADEKFADAEAELADAQADIDDIEGPEVFVLDRSKNAGAAQLSSDADGITQIATFLPFMFFLVAALVSLTSMTRMVDEERLVIGTHKALGYGPARITSKYLVYGVLASGIGSAAGIVALGKLLPWFILTSYQVSYAIPCVPLPIDPLIAAKAAGLSVGVTALATWGAVAASLREKPAALMLPRVPKAGKRIFLERIRPLWSRMSFSHKVTARNLLRYKRRFFMAVVGIAGCTALLMVGFGLRDAIGGIVSNQYEELINYDAVVRMDEDDVDEQRDSVIGALRESDVESYLLVNDFNLIAHGPGDDLRIEVIVPSDPSELSEFVTLRDRETGAGISPDGTDIVLTEKAASVLGARVGDTVELYEENLVGDAKGSPRTFTVGGIAENYLGHYAYLMPDGYRAAFGEEPDSSLAYVKLADGADAAAFSDRLLSNEGVNTVSFVADKIVTYERMLDVMNKLIYIIVLLSAALAFVVLYNLTNIN
ncbi:MAG TPA: ABC transporter permease, partial [Eggerthellaceae bacterium]|nr:ABC transporter permease [Eggerthellaceae bacterium]